MLISILVGALIGAAIGVAIVIVVDYLCTSVIRSRIRTEIPEADYVTVQKIKDRGEVTYGPVYHVKAYAHNGTYINDAEFNCNSSEYFYKNEKIKI